MKIGSVGFIGGGRAARIILAGMARTGALPEKVVVSDPDQAALEALAEWVPGMETTSDNAVAAAREVCFLAVHPPLAKEVVPALAPVLAAEGGILVSLLPKLTIEKLSGMLGGFARIARLIPNAASFVGAGYNPLAFGPGLAEADRRNLQTWLASLGEVPVVEEETLEAYAIVTAMGPTYFWPQFYRLAALAESFGLTPESAQKGMEQMIRGSLAMMKNADLTPEQVQDLIPVKPLADDVDALCGAMQTKLSRLMEKLKP